MTRAEIITIGDEILYGQTLDTNSHWISGALNDIHIKVVQKTTIGDDRDQILTAFQTAEERADIIIITGGLGPTKDDLTKPLLAEYFDVGMVHNEAALTQITKIFTAAGREVTQLNVLQAELPANCDMIPNPLGTASGMWFEERGKVFVSMPGVPFEMKGMMKNEILPRLSRKFGIGVIRHRIIRTIGIGESNLAEIIEDWENNLPTHIKLAYLPGIAQVKLRLTAVGDDLEYLDHEVDKQVSLVLPLIERYVYGYGEEEIYEAVGRYLKEKGKTLALAESCTGGYVSSQITSVPGCSDYFRGSVISYSNDLKTQLVGVDKKLIEANGAVSQEVVEAMAVGVREHLKSDVGIGITGIAGPGGGTEEKPVGTVWLGYSDKDKTISRKIQLTKDRNLNIQYAAVAALNLFRINFLSD